jgi:hypothetical protein
MLLAKHIPTLSRRFQVLGVSPDLYFYDWFLPLFSHILSFDTCTRVWDLYFLHGEIFLFQTALAVLDILQTRLEVLGKRDEVVHELLYAVTALDEQVIFTKIKEYMDKLPEKDYKDWLNRCL